MRIKIENLDIFFNLNPPFCAFMACLPVQLVGCGFLTSEMLSTNYRDYGVGGGDGKTGVMRIEFGLNKMHSIPLLQS